jgi:hypothetical protein
VEHLPWDSAERAALLNDYWRRERLDYLKIHLQGLWGIARSQGHEYPYHIAEAKRCQAIYDSRARRRVGVAYFRAHQLPKRPSSPNCMKTDSESQDGGANPTGESPSAAAPCYPPIEECVMVIAAKAGAPVGMVAAALLAQSQALGMSAEELVHTQYRTAMGLVDNGQS